MYQSFYIKEERLDELKKFIRTETPSVRFKHNPLKEGNQWFIAMTLEVEDSNKLNLLFNKWYLEDNPIKYDKSQCQKCGEHIGLLGRFNEWIYSKFGIKNIIHDCQYKLEK